MPINRAAAAAVAPRFRPGIRARAASAGLGSHTQTAFRIFDDDLVKVETLTAALDITRPVEIAVYVTVFGQMQRTAWFGSDARSLILRARDEFLQ